MSNLAVLGDGGGSVRLVEQPDPRPATGSRVRIRMLRAPINPADLMAIDGRYAVALDPDARLGAEGVGCVEAVGSDVGDLAPGDLVLPLGRGTWSRYGSVERAMLVPVPTGIEVPLAAMLRINPPTARLMLDAVAVGAGDVVVQNGAGSSVAAWVRTLAARRGVRVIDVVRKPRADLPAAIVDGDDLVAQIARAAGGRPVRAALDCVAGEAAGRLGACLAPGGRLIVFGHLSGSPVSVASQVLTSRGLTIAGFSLRPAEAALARHEMLDVFADVFGLATAASPALPVRAVYPIGDVVGAIAAAREHGVGRVQLDFGS